MNGVADEYARALSRPVTYVDIPPETWAGQVLAAAGLGSYVEEHLLTVARLHRENRYDRVTTTVEEITGLPRSPSRSSLGAISTCSPGNVTGWAARRGPGSRAVNCGLFLINNPRVP